MKDNLENVETNTEEEIVFEIIEKVPNEKLQSILDLYGKSARMESYVKLPFLLFVVLFLVHNVFLAGNRYDYNTYETIKNTEISIVVIIILILIIMAIIAMFKNTKVKNELKEVSKRYKIKEATIEEEFSALAIHLYGGRGVKL